ncbi:hypothetical protein ACHAPT_008600 [Fusarium lateritium]
MSASDKFLVPGYQTDLRSSTSACHCVHHQAPPGTGLGWGDWDLYVMWQRYGRSVDKSWVKEGNWEPKSNTEDAFAQVVGGEHPSVKSAGHENNAKAKDWDGAPETLYQKFNPGSRPSNQRGGARGGPKPNRR